MNHLSILETAIQYPEPVTRFLLVDEEEATGFALVAICNTSNEAEDIYDRLTATTGGGDHE